MTTLSIVATTTNQQIVKAIIHVALPNSGICLQAEPVRKGAILFLFLTENSLDTEALVRRLNYKGSIE